MSNVLKLIHQKVAMHIQLCRISNHLDRIHHNSIHQNHHTQMRITVNNQLWKVICTIQGEVTAMIMMMTITGNELVFFLLTKIQQ